MADTPSGELPNLGAVRDRIDSIDRELQRLLNERASCALRVGEIKMAEPSDEPPVPPS